MKTIRTKQNKTTKQEVKESSYNPRLNNIHKGQGLHFLIENAIVVKNNLNNPYYSKEYDSYSSSVGILLTEKLKKEISENLAGAFSKEKGLSIALDHFLTKKITTLEDGKEILYASVKWQNKNGELRLSKPLPIEGIEEGEKFPYSFSGKIQVGISYSIQKTFAVYLNGVIVEEVIQQESEFTGFTATKTFNPSLTATKPEETEEEEVQENQSETKTENKKFKFW